MDNHVKQALKDAIAVISNRMDNCGCLNRAAEAWFEEYVDVVRALGLSVYVEGDEDVIRAKESAVLAPLLQKFEAKRKRS